MSDETCPLSLSLSLPLSTHNTPASTQPAIRPTPQLRHHPPAVFYPSNLRKASIRHFIDGKLPPFFFGAIETTSDTSPAAFGNGYSSQPSTHSSCCTSSLQSWTEMLPVKVELSLASLGPMAGLGQTSVYIGLLSNPAEASGSVPTIKRLIKSPGHSNGRCPGDPLWNYC